MRKLSLASGLCLFLLFVFSQQPVRKQTPALAEAYKEADKIFAEAEKLAEKSDIDEALEPITDEKYRQALSHFINLFPETGKPGTDSLSFFTYFKAGFIAHYFDSIETAKTYYLQSLKYRGSKYIPDSFFFRPSLYVAGIYFSENKFDSTDEWLRIAEKINDSYGGKLNESGRFYNIAGSVSYQTGNYTQARIYFEKALSTLNINDPSEKSLAVNYKINIGGSLLKTEEFDKAEIIYQGLLNEEVFTNEIYQHLGFIKLQQQQYQKSLGYLRKAEDENSKKKIDVMLNMAMAFEGLDQKDSSDLYLLKAKEENLKWNGRQKNVSNGLILKFEADALVKQKRYREAVEHYQESIIQLSPDFNDTAVANNPENFDGTFAYINLFNSLAAKGDALENLYRAEPDILFLQQSQNAYKTAFSLADYVEKTYNSDEARLFLGKIKYKVHSRPIDISLALYRITKKNEYLRDAFLFDQQNKASVLALNVQENELKSLPGVSGEIFTQQSLLKSAITRLSLKLAQTTDSTAIKSLNDEIRDKEIQLEKVQKKLYDDPVYKSRFFAARPSDVSRLQKKLDNKTALMSWHLAADTITAFILTGTSFDYLNIPAGTDFYIAVDSFKRALHNTDAAQRYTGSVASAWLYKKLVRPVEQKLTNTERLIIIPDDELNYLPFEALQDEAGNYLVQKYAISYQYTASLLEGEEKNKKAQGVLAYAPFASESIPSKDSTGYAALPFSGDEISDLKGKLFKDKEALKSSFLTNANHYGIIHLATHANANNESPSQSFITFYPEGSDYKLYASEIYNLQLDSTRLVILSACETGTGKLIKGEGLMSLSRAFAGAGCPNIITSLWKAEDKTTAFITKQLHYYLDKGYTKDKALQQAKLDLLNSKEIAPRYKMPNYWSHLIFIGNYEPDHRSTGWWWVAVSIIVFSLLYTFIKRKA